MKLLKKSLSKAEACHPYDMDSSKGASAECPHYDPERNYGGWGEFLRAGPGYTLKADGAVFESRVKKGL